MRRAPPSRHGLTLVELMVAISIGMAMIALAWTAFSRTSAGTARASARIELHESAAVVREYLARDLGNMAPTLAFFARSQPQVASGADRIDSIEMVFMRTTAPLLSQSSTLSQDQYKSEYHWVRWRFRRTWRDIAGVATVVATGLYRSSSTPTRSWRSSSAASAWAAPNLNDPAPGFKKWTNYGPSGGPGAAQGNGREWINIPRPLRDASEGIPSLDNNRYGVPPAYIDPASRYGDIGDLTDLDRNEELVSDRIRDLTIGWVAADGSAVALTSDAAADQRIDGLYLDVTGPAGNPYAAQLGRRPRLMRVAYSLADATSGVAQDFAVSIASPGLAPEVGR